MKIRVFIIKNGFVDTDSDTSKVVQFLVHKNPKLNLHSLLNVRQDTPQGTAGNVMVPLSKDAIQNNTKYQ